MTGMTAHIARRVGALLTALAVVWGGALTATATATVPGFTSGDSPGVAGVWTAAGPAAPQVILGVAGGYAGNDGCNAMNGRYFLVEGRVQLGPAAKTRRYCGEDIWFEQAAQLVREGERLAVLDQAGHRIGTLHREAGIPTEITDLSSGHITF